MKINYLRDFIILLKEKQLEVKKQEEFSDLAKLKIQDLEDQVQNLNFLLEIKNETLNDYKVYF